MDSRFQLLQHLHGINSRLTTARYPLRPPSRDDQANEQQEYQEAAASVAESLSICDQAAKRAGEVRKNIIEDISIGDQAANNALYQLLAI